MWKKIIFIISRFYFTIFCFNLNAQDNIKKIIYNDLIITNDLYNYNIIDTSLSLMYYDGTDTIHKQLSYNDIKQQYDKNVSVLSVDTIGNFYVFIIEFNNINFNCYPQIKNTTPIFRYVLYKKNKKWLRINGFITSDILFLGGDDLFGLRYINEEKKYQKRLMKALNSNNNNKLSSLLTVSILKFYKNILDSSITARPIISLPTLHNCECVNNSVVR